MAKDKEEKDEKPVDPDQDVWDGFGIEDDEEKSRVRSLAAARVLAHKRINAKPDKKSKSKGWGEE